MMMAIKAAMQIAVGICCIVLGLAVVKKQTLSMIHSSYYNGVMPEDVRAYTSLVGFGVALIGIGICLTGILAFVTKSALTRIPALAGLVAGCIFINKAQNNYNMD